MTERYQLFDLDSGNLAAEFDSTLEAMHELGRVAREFGISGISQLALFRFCEGSENLVAMQNDLVQLVEEHERAALAGSPAPKATRS